MQRLTESEGYFIPLDDDGGLDAVNATIDWHTISANDLSMGHVRPGLGDGAGGLDASRIQGFSNLTPEAVNTGLGIPDEFTVNICITVSDSKDVARIGVQLFCSGALLDLHAPPPRENYDTGQPPTLLQEPTKSSLSNQPKVPSRP